jgi:hypothetical protein
VGIPGIAEAEIEDLGGQGGAETTIVDHPLAIAPGFPAVVALFVLVEKVAPAGKWVSRAGGVVFIGWRIRMIWSG